MSEYKKDDDVLIKARIEYVDSDGTCLIGTNYYKRSFYVPTNDIVKATTVELLNKQYDALLDRFDVAIKALEGIKERVISESKITAKKAIAEVNQMIKDYNDKNELR